MAKKEFVRGDERLAGWPMVALVITSALVFTYLFYQFSHRKRPLEQATASSKSPASVNRYLKEAYFKKMIEEQRIDNEITRKEAKQGLPDVAHPVPQDDVGPMLDLEQELTHRYQQPEQDYDILTPDDKVQYDLKMQQDAHRNNEKMREEFIRQLKENAKKDGFNIKIDKDLNMQVVEPPGR